MTIPSATVDVEEEIIDNIFNYTKDPYGFVLYAFPWGEEGSLKDFQGPEPWQEKILIAIRDKLLTVNEAIQVAVSTGHGVGKSAFVAWIILWSLATFEDTHGIVTANTATQLMTKTWPELIKWYNLFIARHWFQITATSIFSIAEGHEKTWRFDAIPWSQTRTEAFAGMHNQGKRIVLIFDESSGIIDKIWEVAEGALTDKNTQILWLVFGNPTRAEGRFHAAFHGLKHRWENIQVDSRSVSFTNKVKIKEWIEDYGEDSDFVKVRVKGEFPTSTDLQFIPTEYVSAARGKHLREEQFNFAAKIIGVDSAWVGVCAIYLRQGLMCKKLATLRNMRDDMAIAGYVSKFEDEYQADAVFVDMGYGTGIVSAGKMLKRNWSIVPFGGESTDRGYLNKGTDMWRMMRDWLKDGGAIPDDPVLCEQLTNRQHYVVMTGKNIGKINLESKDDMKERGVDSPNDADALGLTFAMPVSSRAQKERIEGVPKYDPYKLNIQGEQKFSPLGRFA